MKNNVETAARAALILIIVAVAIVALFITPDTTGANANDTANVTAATAAVHSARESFDIPMLAACGMLGAVGAFLFLNAFGRRLPIVVLLGTFCAISLAFTSINTLSMGGLLPDTVGSVGLPAIAIGIGLTILVFIHPEWWVIDLAGLTSCAGMAAMLGYIIGVWPCVALLIGLMIYDYIAVYKTKHMITMANQAIKAKLPMLFVVPARAGYSFIRDRTGIEDSKSDKAKERPRNAFMLGFGDAVFPAVLAVAAKVGLSSPAIGFIPMSSAGVIVGAAIAMVVLEWYITKRPGGAPGLPFLCTGAIIGLAAGVGLGSVIV